MTTASAPAPPARAAIRLEGPAVMLTANARDVNGRTGLQLRLRKSLGGYLAALVTRSWPKETLAYLLDGRPEMTVRSLGGEAFRMDENDSAVKLHLAPGEVLYRGPFTVTGCASIE